MMSSGDIPSFNRVDIAYFMVGNCETVHLWNAYALFGVSQSSDFMEKKGVEYHEN